MLNLTSPHNNVTTARRGWNWSICIVVKCPFLSAYSRRSLHPRVVHHSAPHSLSLSTQTVCPSKLGCCKKKKKIDTFHTHGSSSWSSREWWKTFSLYSYAVLKTILLRVKISKSVQTNIIRQLYLTIIYTNYAISLKLL